MAMCFASVAFTWASVATACVLPQWRFLGLRWPCVLSRCSLMAIYAFYGYWLSLLFSFEEAAWPSGLGRWYCNPEFPGSRPPPCH